MEVVRDNLVFYQSCLLYILLFYSSGTRQLSNAILDPVMHACMHIDTFQQSDWRLRSTSSSQAECTMQTPQRAPMRLLLRGWAIS
jgi:hypothetical protein